jgi:NAD(P)-dependent dehydrogenase (short-subunit alcohol dehydrogenase family)
MKLKNRKAIVTGANRNIGRGIAIKLAQQGAEVLISYHSDKKGEEDTLKAIQEIGAKDMVSMQTFQRIKGLSSFIEKASKS